MLDGKVLNKNVLITGAGSGFGRASALRFAQEGARTLFLVDIAEDRLPEVAAEIGHISDALVVSIVADLSFRADCHRAIDEALAADPRLDILISNAAPPRDIEPFLEMREETWDEDLAVNLTASFLLGQRAGSVMREQGGGVILYTASISASGASRGLASYCVTKAGIVSLVKSMALDLAPFGIRVNCVSPGPADTQRSVDLVGEEAMVKFRESFSAVPMNRLASADDVARAFLYLASDDAGYVTGHNLVVDGGLIAQIYEVPEA